jgi:hypothetical protein
MRVGKNKLEWLEFDSGVYRLYGSHKLGCNKLVSVDNFECVLSELQFSTIRNSVWNVEFFNRLCDNMRSKMKRNV